MTDRRTGRTESLMKKCAVTCLASKAFQWGTYPVERGTRPGFNAALARSAGALVITSLVLPFPDEQKTVENIEEIAN